MVFNADGTIAGSGAKAASPNKLSFVQRNLNSIGGGGGAVAGGLTGAAIGSVVPVIGTGIGGILGALIGGAGGGALGEAGKQAAQGNNATLSNPEVQKQAEIQGALGAGGEAGGQLIGRGVSALLGKVAGKGAEVAANPVESILSQGAKASERIGGVDSHAAQQILSNAPQDAKLLTNLGATTPEKMAQAADLTTGQQGFLNSFVRRFIDAGGPVDVSKAQGAADTALSNLTDPVAKREVTKNITDVLSKLKLADNPIGGDVLAKSHPGNVFDAIQTIDNHMNSSDSRPATAAYRSVKAALENALYKGGGANDVVAAFKMEPADQQLVMSEAKNAGLPKVGQHIVDTLNNAQDIGTLRSAQAPFVRAGQAAQAAQNASVGTTGLLANLRSARTPFQMANAPLKTAVQSNLTSSIARLAGNVTRVPAELGSQAIESAGPTLGRAAAQTAVRLPEVGNTQPQTTPGVLASSQDSSTPTDTTTTDNTDATAFSPAVLQAMALHDIQTTGGKNIDKISTLALLFGPNGKTSATSGTTAQKNQQLAANNALAILDNVENNFQAAGGGQGALKGRLANLGTKVNINANLTAYDKNLTDTATALAKAITGSARPAASVIEQYRQSLPMATDSPEVASSKLQQLRDNVQSLLQTSSTGLQSIQ